MAVVDRNGLPIAAGIAGGLEHNKTRSFDNKTTVSAQKPTRLVGDRAYDRDPLDALFRDEKIELISPHRRGRTTKKTRDGRCLRRYRKRWKVEQFFS